MNIDAANVNHHHVGRKCFDVNLVGSLTIERVTDDGRKLRQIDMVDAVADLFVAGETDANRPMWNLGMLDEPGRRFHDDRHAGLIVGTQQRGAVGSDDRPAAQGRELGVFAARMTLPAAPANTMSPPG